MLRVNLGLALFLAALTLAVAWTVSAVLAYCQRRDERATWRRIIEATHTERAALVERAAGVALGPAPEPQLRPAGDLFEWEQEQEQARLGGPDHL